jgi:hypothetical protein
MRKLLVEPGVAGLGVGLVLVGLIVLGRETKNSLRDLDRYTSAFADIDCPAPLNLGRSEFLSEVQYLGGFPTRLHLLEEDLAARLQLGFAAHAWVEEVKRIEIVPPGQVQVELVFRTPVLAVPLGTQVRAVDRLGTLLPPAAPTEGLPVFSGKARPPAGPAGTRWGDPAVEDAAQRAAKGRTRR